MQSGTPALQDIRIYPIKSTQPLSLSEAWVEPIGLRNDRRIAIIDKNNVVITGRSNPNPLRIKAIMNTAGTFNLRLPNGSAYTLDPEAQKGGAIHFRMFGDEVPGYLLEGEFNAALSEALGEPARLVYMEASLARPMKEKNGALLGETVSFADSAPVHLISEASLEDLNKLLEEEVPMDRFRPNLIVQGCDAYEEDHWKEIAIGEIRFLVADTCKRCVFTTLDPVSLKRHPEQEPLRTLAEYRPTPRGAQFGIHLIPLQEGTIRNGDPVRILR